MSILFSLSVGWNLQLGLKRKERNVVKSVVACKSEEQRDVFTGVGHVSEWTCFGLERD